jgi:hypothetical protein
MIPRGQAMATGREAAKDRLANGAGGLEDRIRRLLMMAVEDRTSPVETARRDEDS